MSDETRNEDENPEVKTCRRCGETKPVENFWPDRRIPGGRQHACASCRAQQRAARGAKTNPEASRLYRARHPERFAEQRRRWEARNPEKARAQRAVRNAVRDGRLSKPDRCQLCEKTDKIHGHHDDYANPLSVRWLCPKCHKQAHKEMAGLHDA